ncbi:hypothetical protein MTO96_036775, partial [Rhipicephalus appendiculatus]
FVHFRYDRGRVVVLDYIYCQGLLGLSAGVFILCCRHNFRSVLVLGLLAPLRRPLSVRARQYSAYLRHIRSLPPSLHLTTRAHPTPAPAWPFPEPEATPIVPRSHSGLKLLSHRSVTIKKLLFAYGGKCGVVQYEYYEEVEADVKADLERKCNVTKPVPEHCQNGGPCNSTATADGYYVCTRGKNIDLL